MTGLVTPVWRWRLAVVAVLAVIAGVASHLVLAGRVERRIAGGQPVVAEVISVRRLPVGRIDQPQLVTVRYLHGGLRTATLANAVNAGSFQVSDRITLLADASGVTTTDGYASEGWLLLLPPPLVLYGVITLGGIVYRRLRPAPSDKASRRGR